MSTTLIDSLRREETALLEELNASRAYRRLQEIRKLLALYDDVPPVGAEFEATLRRNAAPAEGGRDILRGIGAAMRETRIA